MKFLKNNNKRWIHKNNTGSFSNRKILQNYNNNNKNNDKQLVTETINELKSW